MRLSTRRREADTTKLHSATRIMSLFAAFIAVLAACQSWLTSAYDTQRRRAEARYPTEEADSAVRRAAQAGIVITVVVIGVVSMVGILIFAQVNQAMPAVNGSLNTTLTSITDGFGNAMSFVPIIMLVLLASVVIGVVQRMRA